MNPAAREKYELLAKPLVGNSILTRKMDSQTLPNVKVFVNQVNYSNSSSANGSGEVKIRFRTVW